MIQHPDRNYINAIYIQLYEQQAYFFHVEEELMESHGTMTFEHIKRVVSIQITQQL